MNKSFATAALLVLITLSISGINASASENQPSLTSNCSRLLDTAFRKKFLKSFDQNAFEVNRLVQDLFPAYSNGIASKRNLRTLINFVIEELDKNPTAFTDTIDQAHRALGHNSISPRQEVAIFMASRTQTLLKFIILSAVGFTNEESVALGETVYPVQDDITWYMPALPETVDKPPEAAAEPSETAEEPKTSK